MHVNNDFQKNSNISHILETIWHNNKNQINTTRIDISRSLDLYRSTVGNVIQTLLDNGVILEGETNQDNEKIGRKPITLSINPKFGCIIGIELQTDTYNTCICNFDGSILFSSTGETPEYNNSSNSDNFIRILQVIIESIYPEVLKLNIPLLSICVGIPGIIDTDKGIIIDSEPFGLKNLPYPIEIAKPYSVPLFFENDAKCCSWYIKSNKQKKPEQDYLCVLTKNHNTRGISIGMSVTLNGRVVKGHNHAVGEYISNSWLPTKNGQTGLAQAILTTVNNIEDSYREWAKDLFSTLTPFIPLLEPQTVYIFGQDNGKKDLMLDVIDKDVIQFKVILERCGSKLKIMQNDDSLIANGAALMFVQKMFEIPSLEENNSCSRLTWDEVFHLQKQ
ncbi:MAG: ROK family protein [Treponema sp.]|nr:ROK family protein [Treponema sp.]